MAKSNKTDIRLKKLKYTKKKAETFTESPEKRLRASFTDWQEAMYDKIKSKKSEKSNRKRGKK